MEYRKQTILAINPGTRHLAFAVIKGDRLIDWGVTLVTADSPQAKLQKTRSLVTRYLEEYGIARLALKALNPKLSTAFLFRQHHEIQTVAQEYGISMCQFSIQEIETLFSPEKTINKRRLAELIAHRHPVLLHELRKEQDALNPYHNRLSYDLP